MNGNVQGFPTNVPIIDAKIFVRVIYAMMPACTKCVPTSGVKETAVPIANPDAIRAVESDKRMILCFVYTAALRQPIDGQKISLKFCKIVRGSRLLNIIFYLNLKSSPTSNLGADPSYNLAHVIRQSYTSRVEMCKLIIARVRDQPMK